VLYGPGLEAAMMENPILEPLYLFGGASPIEDLQHKFTLAKPCQVDHILQVGPLEIGPFQVEIVPLTGHAPNQVGVAVGEVLFCGDAFFPMEALEKHKIPFYFDLDQGLATLERLPGLPYTTFAPGHGPAYGSGDEITRICTANRERLEEIRAQIYEALDKPREISVILQKVADHFELQVEATTIYLLVRTTIFAALSSLERAGEVTSSIEGNRLLWKRV
jgi:glyoxylase-like metal-dependent hydrolase (beta-lactamase superfamily II)